MGQCRPTWGAAFAVAIGRRGVRSTQSAAASGFFPLSRSPNPVVSPGSGTWMTERLERVTTRRPSVSLNGMTGWTLSVGWVLRSPARFLRPHG